MSYIELGYVRKIVHAAVVFYLTSRCTFSIDSILFALVLAPWVVNNACPRSLSPVANSVAFLLVFLFPSSLAVDLPTLFSPKNHDAAHVPTTFSVYSSVCPWVPSLFPLFLALHHSFCAPSKIHSTCDAKSTFQMLLQSFLCHSFECPCLASIQCYTPYKCFDYAFFFSWNLRDPHMRSFFLLKAFFANAMWRLTSHSLLQCSVTILPWSMKSKKYIAVFSAIIMLWMRWNVRCQNQHKI